MLLARSFLLSLGCLAVLVAADTALVVQLREQATVVRRDVRLEDVAMLSGDSRSAALVAGQVVLQIDDRRSHELDSYKIRRQLLPVLDGRALRVQGRCAVERAQVIHDATAIERVVFAHLRADPQLAEGARLRVVRHAEPMVVARNEDQPHQLLVEPLSRQRYGQVPVRVRAMRGESELARALLVVGITYEREAVVATRDLRARHVIEQTDVMRTTLEVDRREEAEAPPLSAVVGRELRGHVRAGDIIPERLVAMPDAVVRDMAVRIRYQRGSVTIVVGGTARQSGAVGDTVRVDTTLSDRTLRCRVTGPGTVTLLQ